MGTLQHILHGEEKPEGRRGGGAMTIFFSGAAWNMAQSAQVSCVGSQ